MQKSKADKLSDWLRWGEKCPRTRLNITTEIFSTHSVQSGALNTEWKKIFPHLNLSLHFSVVDFCICL